MTGTTRYTLGAQIRDNILAHGWRWARRYYIKRGVAPMEFAMLACGAMVGEVV